MNTGKDLYKSSRKSIPHKLRIPKFICWMIGRRGNTNISVKGLIKTKYIRYTRIIKHTIQYLYTGNVLYWQEVQHYYYMKYFTNIK